MTDTEKLRLWSLLNSLRQILAEVDSLRESRAERSPSLTLREENAMLGSYVRGVYLGLEALGFRTPTVEAQAECDSVRAGDFFSRQSVVELLRDRVFKRRVAAGEDRSPEGSLIHDRISDAFEALARELEK